MKKTLTRNPSYSVDEQGNVYNKRGKLLSPKKNWDGYERIQLWSKCRNEFVSIHILIAEAFVPNPNGYRVVNHKNGIKNDNRAENLEWCTQQQNIRHAWDTGLARGTKTILDEGTKDEKVFTTFTEAWRSIGHTNHNTIYGKLRVSKNGTFTFKGHTFHVFGGKYGDTRCE